MPILGNRSEVRVRITGIDNTGRAWSSANRRVQAHQKKVGRLTLKYQALKLQIKQINSVLGSMPVAGAAGLGAIMGFLGKATFEAQMKVDALKNSLIVATGSVTGAELELRKMRDMAADLGVNFMATADSYKKFAIAAKEVGMESSVADKIFRSVTKSSAAMGLSSESTRLTLKALEQMISKGNVQAEELRGQLGEHLPGAFGMAAEAMGITTKELNMMLERGELLATDLLPRLADVLENRFGAVAERAAGQARASLERLKNAWLDLLVAFNRSGASRGIAKVMDMLTEKITKVAENFDQYTLDFVKMLQDWVKAMKLFISEDTVGQLFNKIMGKAGALMMKAVDKVWVHFVKVGADSVITVSEMFMKGLNSALGVYHKKLMKVRDAFGMRGITDIDEEIESAKRQLENLRNQEPVVIFGIDIKTKRAIDNQVSRVEKRIKRLYMERATFTLLPTVSPTGLNNLKAEIKGVLAKLETGFDENVAGIDTAPMIAALDVVNSKLEEFKQKTAEGIIEKKQFDLIDDYTQTLRALGKEAGFAIEMTRINQEMTVGTEEWAKHVFALQDAYDALGAATPKPNDMKAVWEEPTSHVEAYNDAVEEARGLIASYASPLEKAKLKIEELRQAFILTGSDMQEFGRIAAEIMDGVVEKVETLKSSWADFNEDDGPLKSLSEEMINLFGPEGTLISGLSNAFVQIGVFGKKSSDVFKSLGRTILSSVVGALIEAGIQMAINWAKEKLFSGASVAVEAASDKAKAASAIAATTAVGAASVKAGLLVAKAWTPAAVMVSLATLGANAKPASAGIAATASTAIAVKGMTSFDGGGFTGAGTRSGGVDGRGGFPAILHPNETVVDHTKSNAATGDKNVTVNLNVEAIDSASFQSTLAENGELIVSIIRGAFYEQGEAVAI